MESSCNECHHVSGMARPSNQNHDTSTKKWLKASDDDDSGSWSDLNPDILFIVMMHLGVVDFLAFSCVCKSWRSLALSNRNMFMASRKPMSLYIATRGKRACYLHNFEGRKFKTILPNMIGRICVGITCGYLIMFGKKTYDFLLVNLITRHELHFPVYPYCGSIELSRFRGVLAFSPSLSGLVLVITIRYSDKVSFALSSPRARWNTFTCGIGMLDLHPFKGKIYALTLGGFLYAVRINPRPALKPLNLKNMSKIYNLSPVFASSNEQLFVMSYIFQDIGEAWEIDLDEMEVKTEPRREQYALFLSTLKCGVAFDPDKWTEPGERLARTVHFLGWSPGQSDGLFSGNIWYFPHDCYNVNLLQE